MKYILTFSILLILVSCNGSTEQTATNSSSLTNPVQEKQPEDTDPYQKLIQAFQEKSTGQFDQLIHPATGLYIIESSGALPHLTRLSSIRSYTNLTDGRSFFSLNPDSIGIPLKEDELPKVNCDSPSFYTKAGAYFQDINTFKDQQIWNYSNLTEAEKKETEAAAKTISRTVINTYNYRYYFSRIEGRWYLTFLDMRVPCTA